MNNEADPFRALYDANLQRVHHLLARMVGAQYAEDLTQVVFAKAAKAFPEFRGDAQTSTWLYRIAANAGSDWLRSRSMQEAKVTVQFPAASGNDVGEAVAASGYADSQTTPDQELARKELRDCIRREIGRLPETYGTVLILAALGGLSDDEIADTLGISRNNAKVRLHRARALLKKAIGARCDFYRRELDCKPTSDSCCAPAMRPNGSVAKAVG